MDREERHRLLDNWLPWGGMRLRDLKRNLDYIRNILFHTHIQMMKHGTRSTNIEFLLCSIYIYIYICIYIYIHTHTLCSILGAQNDYMNKINRSSYPLEIYILTKVGWLPDKQIYKYETCILYKYEIYCISTYVILSLSP